ncbi:PTS sugar transporter subunit IIC, partial [Photobacterium sanguinicancri]|uniref:PTS sugar transporter subunit IIC n=1 Tax=Photobacterium sanguinicancri TaxID=875932 RepID=UPI0026E2F906
KASTDCGKLVAIYTKVEILVTPSGSVSLVVLVGSWVGPHVGDFMDGLGNFILSEYTLDTFLMVEVVAVIMGM